MFILFFSLMMPVERAKRCNNKEEKDLSVFLYTSYIDRSIDILQNPALAVYFMHCFFLLGFYMNTMEHHEVIFRR